MVDNTQMLEWRGNTMVDESGDKIGKIDEIYVDDQTGEPEWALVNTGLFGTNSNFVPLAGATMRDGDVVSPHDEDTVKDAPQLDADQHLSEEQEAELYRYYGVEYTPPKDEQVTAASGDGHLEEDQETMVRSEEELVVGTKQREAGRLRLRKHVVTEEETATVPVSHEEVEVTREPITDGTAVDGDLSEETVEVTLTEEVATAGTRTVGKEEIHVDKHTVTDEEQVSAEVRKEEVEVVEDDRA